MSAEVKIKITFADYSVDIEPVMKAAAEEAKNYMASLPGLPRHREDYAGSFTVRKGISDGDVVYRVKNKLNWMDPFLEHGHVAWSKSGNGKSVDGVHHFEKGQAKADAYMKKAKIKLKKK